MARQHKMKKLASWIGQPLVRGAGALLIVAVTGCQSIVPPTSMAEVGELRPGSGYAKGYLTKEQFPDSLALVNPAPVANSAQQSADLEVYRATRTLKDTGRWKLAAQDADLHFPAAAGAFACTLGFMPTEEQAPHLTMLMRRTMADAGLATYKAKNAYARERPFVVQGEESCTPAEQAKLSKDGSYPSGHAAIGWVWGLVLASIVPERTDALVQRGHAFGQSRVVCGVHWQSDVAAGREVASAVFARLQSDPLYRAQASIARKEIEQAWKSGLKSQRDCAAEAAALKMR